MSSIQTNPNHLIILCCHAIYIPKTHRSTLPPETLLEANWLIATFQTSESSTFTTHLKTSLDLLSQDAMSHLVISGSKTRPEINLSEAASYLALALENHFWREHDDVESTTQANDTLRRRITLEEKALDSFSNIINSVISFWRMTSCWPEKISIISHAFKESRFLLHHCPTLQLPSSMITYIGIDPDYMNPSSVDHDARRTEEVRKWEDGRGLRAWKSDEWGRGVILRTKRAERNHWAVEQVLFVDEEERARSRLRCEKARFEWEGRDIQEEVLIDGFREVFRILN